jgi:hypothetical protein
VYLCADCIDDQPSSTDWKVIPHLIAGCSPRPFPPRNGVGFEGSFPDSKRRAGVVALDGKQGWCLGTAMADELLHGGGGRDAKTSGSWLLTTRGKTPLRVVTCGVVPVAVSSGGRGGVG